jgi:hypothetical protein
MMNKNKEPSKGGKERKKERTKRERTQVQARRANSKVGHKGAKEQIMFQSPQ